MAVAENNQNFAPLRDKLAAQPPLPQEAAQYSSMRGMPSFRAALAAFLSRHHLHGRMSVDPEHLSVSVGCGAVLSLLVFSLCEAGEAVLIPTPLCVPFPRPGPRIGSQVARPPPWRPLTNRSIAPRRRYAGFLNDVQALADCAFAPVPLGAPDYELTEASLERASRASGRRARMLIVTHPHNPLGRLRTRSELLAALRWCRRRGVHLIADEVYAQSVHPSAAEPFCSVAELCREEGLGSVDSEGRYSLPPFVHVVWSFSKDWGVSGFRTGLAWTSHPRLLAALNNLGYFHAVPNATQVTLQRVLEDGAFTARYLRDNAALLERNAGKVAAVLRRHCAAEVTQPEAGMFVWADLRRLMRMRARVRGVGGREESPFAEERALFEELCDECLLVLSPGESCQASEQGFFRVCVAWVDDTGIDELAVRLQRYVARLEAEAGARLA